MTLDEALADLKDPRELAYVNARVGGMKPMLAARAAGWTNDKGAGTRCERNPRIRAAMDAHYENVRAAIHVTHEEITQMLLDALPMVESATEQVGVAMALNKHMGYEQERTLRIKAEVAQSLVITGNVDVNTMHTLSEAQLLQLAGLQDGDVPWIEGESEEVKHG